MSTAFIIGNGLSRKDIDLTKLKGTTYGCNALYREFTPDYLFAVDNRMQEEIVNSPLFEKNKFVASQMTREKYPDKKIYPLNIPLTVGAVGGADAGYNAFKHVFFNFEGDTVYLLGFDFTYSTKDNKANNIYRGTYGYKSEPRQMDIKQNVLKNILYYCDKKRNKVNFIRVVEPGLSFQWTKKQLDTPTNFIEITVEEFKKDHGC